MGTRYGRRTADGKFEYHDSMASMIAAERHDASETRRAVFALVGLLAGGVLMYALAQRLGSEDWPKWLRMLVVLSGAGGSSWVLALLADILWPILVLCFHTALMYLVGRILWSIL